MFLLELLLILFLQGEPHKLLIRKWELQEIAIGQNKITFASLQSKQAVTRLEFSENGKCQIIPQSVQALPKENKWSVFQEENGWFLFIEAENDFGGRVKQKFKIEKINKKELILSLGEKNDKETYFYKAIR
ncbi:MAG: hypothetical protein RMJ97_02400 [Raineya sp.]|nr:hypothetical protein [Raineya sp.]MDW8295711.1 hypothetical protein [Raineya sp.]